MCPVHVYGPCAFIDDIRRTHYEHIPVYLLACSFSYQLVLVPQPVRSHRLAEEGRGVSLLSLEQRGRVVSTSNRLDDVVDAHSTHSTYSTHSTHSTYSTYSTQYIGLQSL